MVKSLEDLKNKPMESETLRNFAMEIMQYIFTRSQENLNIPMAWGDSSKPSDRPDTIIFDTGELMRAQIPPYWNDKGDMITFEYTSPYGPDVEFGSDPKKVDVAVLAHWCMRKLRKKPKAAWAFAKNISKKIERDGVPCHPFIRPSISDAIAKFNLNIKGPDL